MHHPKFQKQKGLVIIVVYTMTHSSLIPSEVFKFNTMNVWINWHGIVLI